MHLRTLLSLALMTVTAGIPLSCSSAATLHREVFPHNSSTKDSDPISGEWDVTFHVGANKTPASFKFKVDGDKVTGTAYSDHTGAGTIRDGSWKDNKLSFTLDFAKHESIAVTGTLQDGMLAGEFRTEGFTDKWEAKKK